MKYVIDTLVHLHNLEHGVDPRSNAGKRNIGIYTSTEGRSDQMLGYGIYVSTNTSNGCHRQASTLELQELQRIPPCTSVWGHT
jgi:hypothetical protein